MSCSLALHYLQPKMAFLENVLGLLVADQAERVQEKLAMAGYIARCCELNPVWFGWPQSRPRLYFVCVSATCIRVSVMCS